MQGLGLMMSIHRGEADGLGAQVVRISADLLHFHSTPSASESSTGGVDLIGAKVDAQASAKNAAKMTKGRFIAVLPISGACRLAVFFSSRCLIKESWYQALVSACLRGLGKRLR
jgi:hypothetical protein